MKRQRLRRSNKERPRSDWHSSPSTGRSTITATAETTTRAPARRWCRSLPSTWKRPSVRPKKSRSTAPARIRSRAHASRMERIRPTNPGDSVLRLAREAVSRKAVLSSKRRAPAHEDVKLKRPGHTNFPSQRPRPRPDEQDRQSGRKKTEKELEERGEFWPQAPVFRLTISCGQKPKNLPGCSRRRSGIQGIIHPFRSANARPAISGRKYCPANLMGFATS